MNGVAVDDAAANGRLSHDVVRFVVGMAEVVLADVDCFVVMTVVRDYYDYLDNLQSSVHDPCYQSQIRLC